jgi:hypothetical protein
MTNPAFLLCNGSLTYDQAEPNLCTDESHICYGVPVPVPPSRGASGSGGGGSRRYDGGVDFINEFVRVAVLPETSASPPNVAAEVSAYNEEALLGQLAEAKRRLQALAATEELALFYALEIAALTRRVQELEARIIELAKAGAAMAIRGAVRAAKAALLGSAAGESNPAPRYATAAIVVAGVTCFVVPDKMPTLKEAGYSLAAALGVRALLLHLKG